MADGKLSFEDVKKEILLIEKETNARIISLLARCKEEIVISVFGTEWIDDETRYPIKTNLSKFSDLSMYSGRVHHNGIIYLTSKPLFDKNTDESPVGKTQEWPSETRLSLQQNQ